MNHVLLLPTHIMTTNLLARFLDWQDVRSFVVQSKEANELKAGLKQVVIAHLVNLADALNPEKYEKQIESLRLIKNSLDGNLLTYYPYYEKITEIAARVLHTLPPTVLGKLEISPCFMPITQTAVALREMREGEVMGNYYREKGQAREINAVNMLYHLKMWGIAYDSSGLNDERLAEELCLAGQYKKAEYVSQNTDLEDGWIEDYKNTEKVLNELKQKIEPEIREKRFESALESINLEFKKFNLETWGNSYPLSLYLQRQFVDKFVERWVNHHLSFLRFHAAYEIFKKNVFPGLEQNFVNFKQKICSSEINCLLSMEKFSLLNLLNSSITPESVIQITDAVIEDEGINKCLDLIDFLKKNKYPHFNTMLICVIAEYCKERNYDEAFRVYDNFKLEFDVINSVVEKFIASNEEQKALSFIITFLENPKLSEFNWSTSILCALQSLLNAGKYEQVKLEIETIFLKNTNPRIKRDLLEYIDQIQEIDKQLPETTAVNT